MNTAKHYLTHILWKTGHADKMELVLNWNCDLFQIGMRELGILPRQ